MNARDKLNSWSIAAAIVLALIVANAVGSSLVFVIVVVIGIALFAVLWTLCIHRKTPQAMTENSVITAT